MMPDSCRTGGNLVRVASNPSRPYNGYSNNCLIRVDAVMSPATPLAKPFAKPITQCPYCDHVSPPGSKFCGECGAALHLMPCPHCGAVNDITVNTACYRCHGELRKVAPAALTTVAAPTPAATQIEPASPQPDAIIELIAGPPARHRPHALVVGIVLVAFIAAAYFAYRQRSTLDVREPARVEMPPASRAADKVDKIFDGKTDTNAISGTIVKTPAEGAPAVTPSAATTAPAQKNNPANGATAPPVELIASKPGVEQGRESVVPSKTPPAASRSNAAKAGTRADANTGLEKRAPAIGPCTEAVAALGLCTPDPSKR